MPASLPLPTLLSQALVAYTIELDNEAEHRLPHWTTREDAHEARGQTPWLVSYPLWANVLQYLGSEVVKVADLADRARTSRLLLDGLRRWGYVGLRSPQGESLKKPRNDALVRATRHAHRAGEVWRSLPDVIEARWRSRFGDNALRRLTSSVQTFHAALPIDPPAYLPPVYPTQNGRAEAPVARASSSKRDPVTAGDSSRLPELLSGVLLAFTVDFELVSRVSLPIAANTLRVLDTDGVRLRDLPRLTGVSKEANAMCAGWLERRECAVTEPDPAASRGKVLRLTRKGQGAQAKYRRLLGETEEAWRTSYGAGATDALRLALEEIVGDGVVASSPLAAGLKPHPDNWRATVNQPETLPHYPMVLHRGAYPDGA
jgi:DNA-binding MarR family transcriptional regulator